MKSTSEISELLDPYFNSIIGKLSSRVPSPKGRIGNMRTIRRKIEKYFAGASTYAELDNARRWEQFQVYEMQHLSEDSARIFIQDVNSLLQMLHESKKIGLIRLKPPKRKQSSSRGFHVENILHFTFDDVRTLWERISHCPSDEYSLMFVLVVSTCCSASALSRLIVSGIGRQTISITEHGLIHSILLEPCKTLLLRHVLLKKLNKTDRVFQGTTSREFPAWLAKQCRDIDGPMITPSQLVSFGRVLMVLGGGPPYVVALMGKKNSFSPLADDDYEAMTAFLRAVENRIWKS